MRYGRSGMNLRPGNPAFRVLCLAALLLMALPSTAQTDLAAPGRELPFRPGQVAVPCLTPMAQSLHQAGQAGGQAARAALEALRPDLPSDPDRYLELAEGTRVFIPRHNGALSDSRLQKVLTHLEEALLQTRHLLEGYGLPVPGRITIVLAPVESGAKGYLVPVTGDSNLVMVLNFPARGEALARAAVHQYAHAAALAGTSPIPAGWAEAFATWTGIRRTGYPTMAERRILEHRRDHLSDGLGSGNLELSAGNALWFLYLDEAFGQEAVRLTLEELRRQTTEEALELGVRRAAGYSLRQAFRDFHLWAVLTGTRSTGRHLNFAHIMSEPRFASTAENYPALSVHADAPVASMGATQVLLGSDGADTGGLVLRFEGELGTDWEADVLLVRGDGSMHRVPFALGTDGRGEATLPLADMQEAMLLIRNLNPQPSGGQRYTWAAHREAAYPFELNILEALPSENDPAGILISWETESEQDLIGFNILRVPEAGGQPVRINPIWVPAIGDLSSATSYQYMDSTAETGLNYVYHLEGITRDGLASRSGTVASAIPSP